MYERERTDLTVQIAREADSVLWNSTRNIYPVMMLLMKADYELYKKHGLQAKFIEFRNLYKQVENAVRAYRDEATERRQQAVGIPSDD